MTARLRSPLAGAMSGAFGSAWACRSVSHLPDLTPIGFALFTRAMPGRCPVFRLTGETICGPNFTIQQALLHS